MCGRVVEGKAGKTGGEIGPKGGGEGGIFLLVLHYLSLGEARRITV